MSVVIFDMDGVLVDSEQVWDQARKDVVAQHGGQWTDSATTDMLGMSSKEWPVYLIEQLGVKLSAEEINDAVVAAMRREYERELPLLPCAQGAVYALGERHTLGLASSSNRPVIDLVLQEMGVRSEFAATVSSEEVARGKPAPDVYQEALRRLGADTGFAIEDSEAGIRSAHAAGLTVIAVPNPHFPPSDEALALADLVLEDLCAVRAHFVAQDAEPYRRAIAAGDVSAWVPLAELLTDAGGHAAEAEAAWRAAVEAGVAEAPYLFAAFLRDHKRVEEAVAVLEPLAGAGDMLATYGLGVINRDLDWEAAERQLRAASDAGIDGAHAPLASLLAEQFRDSEAEVYHRRAAAAGDEMAQERD